MVEQVKDDLLVELPNNQHQKALAKTTSVFK